MATPLTRVEHRSSEADLDAMWAERRTPGTSASPSSGRAHSWWSSLAPAGHLGRLPEMALWSCSPSCMRRSAFRGCGPVANGGGHAYLVLAWLCVLGMRVLNTGQSPVVVAVLHPLPHLWVVLHTRLAIITTVLIPRRALAVIRIAQSDGSREVLTSIGLGSVISLGLSPRSGSVHRPDPA